MSMTAATAISAQQQQQQQPLVFLGGTVGENHWREEQVIPALLGQGSAARTRPNEPRPTCSS